MPMSINDNVGQPIKRAASVQEQRSGTKKLQWWFRIVGGFYVLVSLMNLYGVFVNPPFYAQILPYAASEAVLRAFTDAWMVFVFEFLGIGLFLLWASRDPLKNVSVVWLIVIIEALRGVLADLIWISRGFNPANYIVWIVIHVAIIVTGILFARQARDK